jgi:hypothetical protein
VRESVRGAGDTNPSDASSPADPTTWPDVTEWYWDFSLSGAAGPWWVTTVAERAPE